MDISMGICYLRKQCGTTEMRSMRDCARITREAGFQYVDYNGTWSSAGRAYRPVYEAVLRHGGLSCERTSSKFSVISHRSVV